MSLENIIKEFTKECGEWCPISKKLTVPEKYINFITQAHQLGKQEGIEECLKIIQENREGSFTDDAGNDCWYIDKLIENIKSLIPSHNGK